MSMDCTACSQRLQNLIQAISDGRIRFSGNIVVYPVGEGGTLTFFLDRFGVIRQVFAEGWELRNPERLGRLLARTFQKLEYLGGDYWIPRQGLPIWQTLFPDLMVEGESSDFVRVTHGRL